MQQIDAVVFADGCTDCFSTAIKEFLSYNTEYRSALLGRIGADYTVNNDMDVIRWMSIDVDPGGCEMVLAVVGGSARKTLSRSCVRCGCGTP